MVRGKTPPVRSLAENLHAKVNLFEQNANHALGRTILVEKPQISKQEIPIEVKPIKKEADTPKNNTPTEQPHNDGEIQLTALQNLISKAIISNKGAIHFHALQDYISINWDGLQRGRDGQIKNTDCKRAILASLSKNIRTLPLFKRARGSSKYWWQLGEYNPLFTAELDTIASELPMIDEPLHVQPEETSNGKGSKSKGKGKDNCVLTELQVLIIQSIADRGGKATIDEITEGVSQQWGSLRRRDGSKYTADCRRAVQASLANNPSSKPIFRRESRKKGIWGLAKRAIEHLENKGIIVEESDEKGSDVVSSDESTSPLDVNAKSDSEEEEENVDEFPEKKDSSPSAEKEGNTESIMGGNLKGEAEHEKVKPDTSPQCPALSPTIEELKSEEKNCIVDPQTQRLALGKRASPLEPRNEETPDAKR